MRACHSARVALATNLNNQSSNIYEIVIGGWSNIKSVIRKSIRGASEVEEDTPEILSCDRLREFYLSWKDGLITVSTGAEFTHVFLSWKDPAPFQVNYMSVSTGWGATGEWQIPHSHGEYMQQPLQ